MGVFDFVKDAGKRILGRDDEPQPEATPARPGPTVADVHADRNRRLGGEIVRFVEGLGLPVEDLSVRVEGETAHVKGKVPTQDDREKVILAAGNVHGIARVDDKVAVGGGAGGGSTMYTVKSGDTLSKIARQHYGDANAYHRIFEANRPLLEDPDEIYPGQVLRIPPKS